MVCLNSLRAPDGEIYHKRQWRKSQPRNKKTTYLMPHVFLDKWEGLNWSQRARVMSAQINITVYSTLTTHFSTWGSSFMSLFSISPSSLHAAGALHALCLLLVCMMSLSSGRWEPTASEDGRRHIRPNGFSAGAGGSAVPHVHMFL